MSRPRALLFTPRADPKLAAEVDQLRGLLAQHLEIVADDDQLDGTLEQIAADLVVVLGGDGSILRAVHKMGRQQRPVLGVNLGRLGFLAGVSPGQLPQVLPQIAAGGYRVVDHLMFECRVLRDDQVYCEQLGLNEIAVLAGPPFRILDVELYVDAELATTYSCDGLIVSTPVGSTAHSLSAGGPILRNDLQAFVISPISPHALTMRPVVDSAERKYELVVPRPHDGTTLVVDGKTVCSLTAADRVCVERADARFQMIEVAGQGYYHNLREKLKWGGGLRLGE